MGFSCSDRDTCEVLLKIQTHDNMISRMESDQKQGVCNGADLRKRSLVTGGNLLPKIDQRTCLVNFGDSS